MFILIEFTLRCGSHTDGVVQNTNNALRITIFVQTYTSSDTISFDFKTLLVFSTFHFILFNLIKHLFKKFLTNEGMNKKKWTKGSLYFRIFLGFRKHVPSLQVELEI